MTTPSTDQPAAPAPDPFDAAVTGAVAARAPGGFLVFVVCLAIGTTFELIRFPERRATMLAFAAGFVALIAVTRWAIARWPRWTVPLLLAFVNLVGVGLNAYHALVGAAVAMCLWTLTGLLCSAAVILPWGASAQALATLGALLSYPLHWQMGIVEPWTWAAGGSYLLVMAGMSVFGAHLFDRSMRTGLQLSAALSEREARLQSYFDLAPVGTVVLASDGHCVEVNDALCSLLGAAPDAILGRPWPPFGGSAVASDDLDDGRSHDAQLHRRDGETIDAVVGARTLPVTRGAPGRTILLVEDVTLRKRIDAERESLLQRELAARRDAEAANHAKDVFLATLSHELRTPLTPIVVWADLLRSGQLDAAQTARAVETIGRSARTQVQLVDDLLDISRIAAGKLRIEKTPVTLDAVVAEAVEMMRPAARTRDVTLEAITAAEVRVAGDAHRLRQVIWNLLSNALDFTPSGGRVDVVLDRAGDCARVVVRDTGCGIAADFLPQVFERFRQAESSRTRRHGGLGIGLALVREIVERHGGRVRAESDGPDRGATFTVELPLLPAGVADAPAPAVVDPAALRGIRVLVVDDDHDGVEAVRALLRAHGAEVSTADSAPAALAQLRRLPCDVLVSDIAMPREDGYALLAQVRAGDAGAPALPAIALTACSGEDERARILAAGFLAHETKPIRRAELVAAVAAAARVAPAPGVTSLSS